MGGGTYGVGFGGPAADARRRRRRRAPALGRGGRLPRLLLQVPGKASSVVHTTSTPCNFTKKTLLRVCELLASRFSHPSDELGEVRVMQGGVPACGKGSEGSSARRCRRTWTRSSAAWASPSTCTSSNPHLLSLHNPNHITCDNFFPSQKKHTLKPSFRRACVSWRLCPPPAHQPPLLDNRVHHPLTNPSPRRARRSPARTVFSSLLVSLPFAPTTSCHPS